MTRGRRLQSRLRKAGARVSLRAIAGWTSTQKADAALWADAQIAATAKDTDRQTSVRWPDHVGVAHQERAHALDRVMR